MGARDRAGYGMHTTAGSRDCRRQFRAHRFAYEDRAGTIGSGLLVCHRCDNPPCCNPAHLFLGTHADNHADKVAKGRSSKLFGRANPQAKLTEADVAAIRASTETCRVLRARFGVSGAVVSNIRRGISWVVSDVPFRQRKESATNHRRPAGVSS